MKEAWGEGLVDIGDTDLPDECIIRDSDIAGFNSTDQGWKEQVRTGTDRRFLSSCAGGGECEWLTQLQSNKKLCNHNDIVLWFREVAFENG